MKLSGLTLVAYSLCSVCVRPAFAENPYLAAVQRATDHDLREYDLAEYVSEALNAWVPVRYHNFCEPQKRTEKRYWELAQAIAKVALNHEPLFDDDAKHVKTALVLASVASFEGRMIARYMDCKEPGMGHAWGPYQCQGEACKVHVCGSYEQATVFALEGHMPGYVSLRESMHVCGDLPETDRLAGYTDGKCFTNWKRSRVRVQRALAYYHRHPADFGD